ncbi:MAG: serine protease spb1 [Proteobacteria bacterium]|nr:MAG: serine protease spb1 [Pseudomonadota bacterium]
MFGKLIAAVALALILSSCARPIYQQVANEPRGTTDNSKASRCDIRFTQSQHCLEYAWVTYPTESKPGEFLFKIYRLNLADQSPMPVDHNLKLQVVLWMPSMGHGSTPVTVTRLDVGTFSATKVFFVMPGEWEIKFQLKDEEALQDEAILSLNF